MTYLSTIQVIQQAVEVLARWAVPRFTHRDPNEAETILVHRAKRILGWFDRSPTALELVFDRITLEHSQGRTNYRPAWALQAQQTESRTPRIPYAQSEPPTEAELENLKQEIRSELGRLDWQNLSQISVFLEKFGSHLSAGEADIAIVDQARSIAALAAALAQNPPDEQIAIVAGDLSGVQKFIYTISSEGALKSLRARSFYLELATEEIVLQLLAALDLPRTNIIYAGASKFYLLAAATEHTREQVKRIQEEFNVWLREKFQGKVFLAIAQEEFPATDLATDAFSERWRSVNRRLAEQTSRKFVNQLDTILRSRDSHEPCKVCHRDDTLDLKPLKEDDSVLACDTCREMYKLGGQLLKAEALVRSPRSNNNQLAIRSSYYRIVPEGKQPRPAQDEAVFLINNWTIADYASNQFMPLLLSNYGKESKIEYGFMSTGEMADSADGIRRVGYLRMDVDRLSQIFSKGLASGQTLPRLASLSRQMTYFFKVYLNSLAETEPERLPHQQSDRRNLLFIYAGGDDLFISGAWNEIVEFAFDVYQSFRNYTGQHPDITLSAGIAIEGAKFPLYQAADRAGELEDDAKANDRDSLALFGEVFQWSEWLGEIQSEAEPEYLGVLPFVRSLLQQRLEVNASRAFVRNLLSTAQQQNQLIRQRQQQIRQLRKTTVSSSQDRASIDRFQQELEEIPYYLHLPKIAYALARLPKHIRDRPDFQPIRRSLKHPQNAPYFRAIATWIEVLSRNRN